LLGGNQSIVGVDFVATKVILPGMAKQNDPPYCAAGSWTTGTAAIAFRSVLEQASTPGTHPPTIGTLYVWAVAVPTNIPTKSRRTLKLKQTAITIIAIRLVVSSIYFPFYSLIFDRGNAIETKSPDSAMCQPENLYC
jgi:hypothetical protein